MTTLKEKPFFKAILNATDTISTILSPIVFISVLSDFENVIDFIGKYGVFSVILLLFLLVIFGFHLIHILKEQRNQNKEIESNLPKKSNWSLKRVVLIFGTVILISSLIFTGYVFSLTANGFYYPVISSHPKNNIKEFVTKINNDLKNKGYEDFQINYYCKIGNDYCALVPNGAHLSEEEAKNSIQKALQIIPFHVADDHRIDHRPFNVTILGKIRHLKSKLPSLN